MEIIRTPRIVRDTCRTLRMKGKTIGFVPTMGALHEGHLSLVRRSKTENDVSLVSIFVNPTQFGPAEDFGRYPRPIEEDIRKLEASGSDILFLPEAAAIYPPGFSTSVTVESLSERLCGQFRPGHFKGVATVVTKLLNISAPTRAYFGQKDFQQTVIIRRLVRDLDLGVDVVVCPTIREEDGLAMSSRNVYLDSSRRKAAAVIFRSLTAAAEAIHSGSRSSESLRHQLGEALAAEPLITRIEYASLYDPETLEEVVEIRDEVLIAAAVRLGEIRLIDNLLVTT